MAEAITYRTPKFDEWEKLRALRLRSVKEHPVAFGKSFEEEESVSETKWRERMVTRQYIVAEKDGEFVGMLAVAQGDGPKSVHTTHVYSVYVAPAVRGSGVGRGLMERAIADARAREGVIKIGLNVAASQEAARALYEKMGFEVVGTLKKDILVDDVYTDDIAMEMMLK